MLGEQLRAVREGGSRLGFGMVGGMLLEHGENLPSSLTCARIVLVSKISDICLHDFPRYGKGESV
jgi:hypothetical protein